ncbi:hypothetical protein F2P81_016840 [Scophthalmus maximus]|uniref:Uncharacterized protein n=1 Tax=Scophthalmus maximus TaxID=52904 RepID=A0A6A4RN08_SCOMX|nr:hypothetical protein F2P81_026250 [Scophthalmus maximus]KAF0030109.1 hypothetical protein F2P81_016840 [Scophthalmus maximus]
MRTQLWRRELSFYEPHLDLLTFTKRSGNPNHLTRFFFCLRRRGTENKEFTVLLFETAAFEYLLDRRHLRYKTLQACSRYLLC